jgi:hypothetical protein
MISIDGVDLPAPTKYKIPNMDLDSSAERNELGVLQRDRIRSNVFKVELEFTGITSSDLALIKSAISPAEFKATIMTEIGLVTKKMYVGDRNIEMIKYDKDYNKIRWNISFNLTEY